MKRFSYIIATILSLVIVGMTVYSCRKTEPLIPEPEPQDVLTIVSPGDKVVIMSEGETISVRLKTNCNWAASTDADWLSLSRVSGTASLSEFDITVKPNRGEDRREASVTLKAGSKTAEIAITQLPHVDVPTDLKVTESYELGYEGETIRIEFSTNKEWLVVATEPWIIVSPSSGTDKETFFDLTVGENPSVEPRSGYLTVTASDKSAVVSVTQAGNPNAESHIDIDGSLSFGYEGGPLTVDFTTNKDWTVSTEADWLTLDPVSGTPESASFKVIASGNGEATKRTAEIVVAAGEKTVKVSVEQDAAPADGGLRVEGNGNVSWEKSSVTVNVKSSTDWHVYTVEPEDGIYWSHTVGEEWPYEHGVDHKASDTSFEISYGNNWEYQSRTMTYIITAGDKTAYFVLCQEAYPVTELSVTDRDVVFGPKADSFTLNFESSYAWTASANVPWITLSATEGVPETGESSSHPDGCHFDISVPDYDRGVKRVGTVTISSGGKTVNVTVTQMGVEVVEFEDALFKDYCISRYDSNHDGELDTEEAQAITEIDVSWTDVASLKGVQSMPNLTRLSAVGSKLQSLDISNSFSITRVYVYDCELSGVVNLSNCSHLEWIDIENTKISGIVFKNNRAFQGFNADNCCLTGVLDMTEASDYIDDWAVTVLENPNLEEIIVKDERCVKHIRCEEGVKVTVRH